MITEIAIVQTTASTDRMQNLERTSALVREASASGAQVVCLQELFSTPYFCQSEQEAAFSLAETLESETLTGIAGLARELEIVLIAPFFERLAPGVFYNSAAVFDVDGDRIGLYRKMHIPDDPQFMEKYYFTPSDDGVLSVKTRFGTIGVCICWDQWFPEVARLTALAGAEIIFYPTAIGWLPEDLRAGEGMPEDQCDAWRTMQRSHAIANGCFVAAANRVGLEKGPDGTEIHFWGQSFVVNPAGRVIASAGSENEEILRATVDFSQIETQRIQWPFFRDRRIDAYGGLLKRFGS